MNLFYVAPVPPAMAQLDPLRLAIGFAVLGAAALQDIRSRRASDYTWAMGWTAALVVGEMDLVSRGWDPLLQAALLGPFLLFIDAIWDRDDEAHPVFAVVTSIVIYIASVALLLIPGVLLWQTTLWGDYVISLVSGLTVGLGFLMYGLGLLRGGADAKAFMFISLSLPLPPRIGTFPLISVPSGLESLEIAFPFALVVLMDASITVLVLPIAFLSMNIARRDVALPQALFGFRASVLRPPAFVWWMEGVDGGRRVVKLLPRKDQVPDLQAAALASIGVEKAWATPQIPFLVPLLVGLVVAAVFGNLFLGLLLVL